MTTDRYLTLSTESEGTYREKASKFMAYAFPLDGEAGFTRRCAEIAREHHASRHVCYAWLLGEAGDRYRANDAGEPSGTAGRPILRQLQSAHLTNAAVVVVRYFGGTLLGKAGLVHAYAEAARIAINNNLIVGRFVREDLIVRCSYAQVEAIKGDVVRCTGELISADYADACVLHVSILRSEVVTFTHRCRLAGANVRSAQPK